MLRSIALGPDTWSEDKLSGGGGWWGWIADSKDNLIGWGHLKMQPIGTEFKESVLRFILNMIQFYVQICKVHVNTKAKAHLSIVFSYMAKNIHY